MGDLRRPNSQVQCQKHPKHRQSPGVCSVCLVEKLSRLRDSSSKPRSARTVYAASSSCSSSSCSSSYYSSVPSCSSPASPLNKKGIAFGKSRSVAFLARMKPLKVSNGGFWEKLFRARPRSQKNDALQSRTLVIMTG